MLSEIPTALAALSNLKDLTKSIVSSKVEAALREQAIESGFAIIEAQSAITSLQTQYQSLLEEKNTLKQQLIEMQNWEAESAKYQLSEVATKIFVYALKPDYTQTEPAHWLCANCYQNKQKSILQRGIATSKGTLWHCSRCPMPLIFNLKHA